MTEEYFVPLSLLIERFELETIYMPEGGERRKLFNADINRPALQFIDFFDYFDPARLQVVGKVEMTFLECLSPEQRLHAFDQLFSKDIPALVITRSIAVFDEIVESAKKYGIPVFRTDSGTSNFLASIISLLSVELAPRVTRHGVLVEVYGEGILLLGESGVGKSETAVELVKRGHRLVADDAVEIKRVSDKTLVGESPEIIRHFIELRGIGVVDVRRIFGMGSVKETEKIDLVVQLEEWDDKKPYDRFGLEVQTFELLGLAVDSLTIPVKPGRNLAIIVEVAAMNNRQKKMGFNAAQELSDRLTSKFNFE